MKLVAVREKNERELKASREKALEFLDSISRNLDSNSEQQYIEKCIRNIIDTQTRKMDEFQIKTSI